MAEEKTKFGFKVLVGLWRAKTFLVLVYPKDFCQNIFFFLFAQ